MRTQAFVLSVAGFHETPGAVRTKHSVKKQEVNECYQKNARDFTLLHVLLQYTAQVKAERLNIQENIFKTNLKIIIHYFTS